MPGPGSIPDDVRWKIAAEFSAELPALYDRAFREVVKKQFDELEQEVWMEASLRIFDIARDLALPVGTPAETGETLRSILLILFGPEFRSETLEVSKEGAVIIIRRCPLLIRRTDAGVPGEKIFHSCLAFVLTGVPRLNRDFSARFVRTLCTGDRQCEIKIERTKPENTSSGQKG